ncbi:MAG: long-chain fatty acid--CoA ligase [Candidatus Marinimicrobia bacterium]|nr:long-chain fatty acid--CoA ligase [Candidatus Neomarinimicrobiota bacterium]
MISDTYKTIPQLFKDVVEKYKSRTALRYKELGIWHDVSWEEYYLRAQKMSAALIENGLKKGDKVAIIGDNSKEWVTIDLGCLLAGGVTVGIYSTSAWQQCEYIVNHSESVFLFVENEEQLDKWLYFREKTPHLKKVIFWDEKGLQHFEDQDVMTYTDFVKTGESFFLNNPGKLEKIRREITPEDHAMIIYTSGTTGRPKGAVLNHRNITWMSEAISTVNPLYETDEALSYLPLCHIFERLFSVIAHLKYGYIVNFIENLDTVAINMREISPTIGYGVPRIWEKYHSTIMIKMDDATWFKRTVFHYALSIGKKYVQAVKTNRVSGLLNWQYHMVHFLVFRKLKERLGFDRIRIAYSGAAPISVDILLFFQLIGVNLLEGYGQTEAVGVTTVCKSGEFQAGTVGVPLPGSEVKIAEDGEIIVKSPAVFVGYYKEEKTTSETLMNGWMHSGDLGELDLDGNLKITGRKKDIIVTAGGKNITPQFIENQLKFSPYINDAVVIGDGRKFITAMIAIDEDNVVKYAQDNKIPFSTYGSLTENEEIKILIQTEVDKVNTQLAHVEQIKKFTILPKKLYEEDGEVTPTMKVKRISIDKMYKNLIDKMYEN